MPTVNAAKDPTETAKFPAYPEGMDGAFQSGIHTSKYHAANQPISMANDGLRAAWRWMLAHPAEIISILMNHGARLQQPTDYVVDKSDVNLAERARKQQDQEQREWSKGEPATAGIANTCAPTPPRLGLRCQRRRDEINAELRKIAIREEELRFELRAIEDVLSHLQTSNTFINPEKFGDAILKLKL